MIKHVYLYRLLPKVNRPEVAEKLKTLKAHIPEIHDMEVALDFKHAYNSYDLIESCSFLTMEDFLAFGKNEYHESIRQYMATVQECGVKIDYEA